MFRWKRLTGYYVIEQQGDDIYVSHLPRWIFYYADKQKFFLQRRIAYAKLAELLQQTGFWPSCSGVISRSLTIDFARDTVHARAVLTNFFDKPSLLLLWLANVYNWRPSRLWKLVGYLLTKRAFKLQMDREAFVTRFGKEVGRWRS